jgi:hypothetical protein
MSMEAIEDSGPRRGHRRAPGNPRGPTAAFAVLALGIFGLFFLVFDTRQEIEDLRAEVRTERQERRQMLLTIRGDINQRVVPDVNGLTVMEAKALLIAAGLQGSVYEGDPSDGDQVVLAQEPGPGGDGYAGCASRATHRAGLKHWPIGECHFPTHSRPGNMSG